VVNSAPVANDDGPFEMRPGQTLTLDATVLLANDTDADEDGLYLGGFQGNSSQGGTISAINAGQLLYTPAAGFTGTDSFMISVDDGFGGSATSVVTIDVVNSAPVANDDGPFSVARGQTLTLDVAVLLANDTDADEDGLYLGGFQGNSSQGGTISAINAGQLLYTPAAGFTGTDMFMISVDDGFGGSDTATVTLIVTGDPPPPQESNAVLPSVPPGTEGWLNFYIHFEGISGQQWLELGSFNFGLDNSVSPSGAGGRQAGKATATDVITVLGSSATSTALLEAIASGKHLSDVEVEVYRAGLETKDRLVAEYKFSDVVLTGLNSFGGEGVANYVSFDYGGFGQRFFEADSKTGQTTGNTETKWSFIQNNVGDSSLLPQSGAQAIAQPQETQNIDGSQLEYYVRFDGVNGWLALDSYSLGIEYSAGLSTGGGGAGKSTASDVVLTLGASTALTGLTGSLFSGKHLQNVEIEVYRSGLETKDVLIEELRFDNVFISGLSSGNVSNNLLSFDYGQISRAYRDVDGKGALTPYTKSGWNFSDNTAYSGPNPVADANGTLPLDSIPTGADLDYYIHFEGVSGSQWLSLGSFSFGVGNTSQSGGGGGGAGKVQVTDVVSSLGSSATATALLNAIGSGKILNDVEIEAYRPGDISKDQLVAEYKFSGVVLTGLDSYGGGDQIGTSVSFDYLGFGQRNFSFDNKTGQPTGEATASWDLFSNTPGGAGLLPQSGAQAIAQPSELQTGGGSNLEYYVRFDGINGWLELDSYSLGIDSSLGIGVGGIPQVGKATAGDVALSLGASAAFTTLTASLLSGKYLANVEIEVYQPGDKKDVLI
ncbi:MAG: type VI secretion system tube protein Hcp, partial [Gammaproteobacteria bacterium]|nr:type VI secretion system tube protein Hcp [Gammaproteobacteria bacterium]